MEAFINEMVQPRVLDLLVLILPKWRLLVFIFLMNIVIFTPVYVFGILLINDVELALICPPVLLFGFNLVHRAVFRCQNLHNTRTILLGVAILSVGISASGLVAMYTSHYWLMVLLYSVVGGLGYQLVFSKMWKVLGKIFNARKEMFVIKFLHSCGQATSLLVLLLVFHLPWEDYVCGALLLLLTGIVLHLVPITLLIECEKNRLKLDLDSLVRITEKGNESYYAHVTRPTATIAAQLTCPAPAADTFAEANELQPLYGSASVGSRLASSAAKADAAVTWKNPANFAPLTGAAADGEPGSAGPPRSLRRAGAESIGSLHRPGGYEYDYEEELCRRDDGKFFNQDGVEILEMILEEDEANMAAYEAATAGHPQRAGRGSLDEASASVRSDADSQSSAPTGKWHLLSSVVEGAARAYHALDFRHTVNLRLVASVRCALLDFRCYSCVLLKATDVCIFVLFLAILPRFQAFHYHQRARARQMTLLSVVVISSAWAGFSFLLLWCEIRFRKQQERLLIFSILFQAFGYFCVYSIKSSFWTITGCVLVGVGHSIACSYQDLVIKRKFSQRQWSDVKAGLSLLSGLVVLAIAGLANVLYVYGRIDNLLLVLLLIYCASSGFWLACNCRIFFS
uniref:Transmembrane protein n=1 Tax=Anopheles atroparvus TaxID=41427 RepID=A0AAG5DAI8_ANOAO